MGYIHNKYISRERRRKIYGLFISIIFVLLGLFFLNLSNNKEKEVLDNALMIDDTILNDETNRHFVYLDITKEPYQIAYYENIDDSYLMVDSNNHFYILYMHNNDYEEIKKDLVNGNSKKIYGVTKKLAFEIKPIAIDYYNALFYEAEEILTFDDFADCFGSIYIDTTAYVNNGGFYYILGIICFIVSFIFLAAYIIRLIIFNRNINKVDKETLTKLNDELQSSDIIYLKRINLILTNSYIVNMVLNFNVIRYSDIIWIYPHEHYSKGVKTSRSIIVVLVNGKKYTVATIEPDMQEYDLFQQVWNHIISKNSNILVGYNNENIQKVNEIVNNYRNGR